MQHDWVAVDVETATPDRDSCCSIAAVRVRAGGASETFHRLVRPPRNAYGIHNTMVHGLGPADTAGSPSFGDVWDAFEAFVGGRPLVAHNAAFDRGVVRRSLEATGREHPGAAGWSCTVALGRLAWPDLPDHRLLTVCAALGIALTDHHEAVADARACASVGLAILERAGTTTFAEVPGRLRPRRRARTAAPVERGPDDVARAQAAVDLWLAGATLAEIGAGAGPGLGDPSALLNRLRKHGLAVPGRVRGADGAWVPRDAAPLRVLACHLG